MNFSVFSLYQIFRCISKCRTPGVKVGETPVCSRTSGGGRKKKNDGASLTLPVPGGMNSGKNERGSTFSSRSCRERTSKRKADPRAATSRLIETPDFRPTAERENWGKAAECSVHANKGRTGNMKSDSQKNDKPRRNSPPPGNKTSGRRQKKWRLPHLRGQAAGKKYRNGDEL